MLSGNNPSECMKSNFLYTEIVSFLSTLTLKAFDQYLSRFYITRQKYLKSYFEWTFYLSVTNYIDFIKVWKLCIIRCTFASG